MNHEGAKQMMTTADVVEASHACLARIARHCRDNSIEMPPAKKLDDLTQTPWRAQDGLGHLRFMCEQVMTWMDAEAIDDSMAENAMAGLKRDERFLVANFLAGSSQREKAMRWLGFVQGTLWAWGLASIDEMRRMNAPGAEL